MRHRVAGRRFDMPSGPRRALFRNLVTDMLRHGHITTTVQKAKETQPFAEKMVTLGKLGSLHARRQAAAFLTDKSVVEQVFGEIARKNESRPGGYTRIVRIGPRKGDGAEMAVLELVE